MTVSFHTAQAVRVPAIRRIGFRPEPVRVPDGRRPGRISGGRRLFRLLWVAGFLFLLQPVKSQTFTEVDIQTYQLYLEKNWDELIRAGKSVLKLDFDYYYLRMRIGIAYYEKKNYKSAQYHFKKALEFSAGDPVASEYLYYAYLFGGQTQQAAILYEDFPDSYKQKIPEPGGKPVDRLGIEYLYNHTFTDDLIDDPGTFDGLPYGVQIITRNYRNMNLSLTHQMHPGTSFTHAYTYLGKDSYYYYDDGVDSFCVEGQRVKQHQYYLSPSITSGRGYVFSPFFHFLYISYEVPDLTVGGPGPGGGSGIVFRKENETQIVAGGSLAKFLGPVDLRVGGLYSNMNLARQFSGTAGLTWYPLGNLNLYLGAFVNAHMQDIRAGGMEWIPELLFGFGIASRAWVELSGAYGEMKNYTGPNGFIVYNGLDWMKYKALANIIVPLTKKGSRLYVGARYAGCGNRFIPLDLTQPEDLNDLTFNSISIFGGLSWKF